MEATRQREETRALGRDLRRAIPETYRAYGQLHAAALAPGKLSTATKELIALAIAVSKECDGCIGRMRRGPPGPERPPRRSQRPLEWPSS